MSNLSVNIVLDLAVLIAALLLIAIPLRRLPRLRESDMIRPVVIVLAVLGGAVLFHVVDLLVLLKAPDAHSLTPRFSYFATAWPRLQMLIGVALAGGVLHMLLHRAGRSHSETIRQLETALEHRERSGRLSWDRHLIETEQLRCELRVQREFMNAFFESAPAGLLILDSHYRVLQANRTFLRVIHAESTALVGRSLFETLPELEGSLSASLEQTHNTGRPVVRSDALPPRGEGRRRWMTFTCFPILVEPVSKQPGFGIIFVDTEKQHRLEERLRQNQKLEAIGRLAGGVAHDFNNLLMVIQYAGDRLLQLIGDDEKARVELRDIVKATESAGALTRQLLAFSRMQVLELKIVDLPRAVDAMRHMLTRTLGQTITIDTRTGNGPAPIRIDPVQLDSIVLNLAINARDAMPGGGRLLVQCERRLLTVDDVDGDETVPPGEYAVLRVTDTGTGMNRETVDRIFEPFFTTKGRREGTGLGLATVHGIVNQSGGIIRVHSSQGCGTTFELCFPIADSTGDAGQPERARPAGAVA